MTTLIPSKTTVSYDSVKLGIDAHAKYYWVSRQLNGATPQPIQKITYDELLLFVVKQQKLNPNVVTCYEAGAFGFHLHRKFEQLGIKNYVVQPQDWSDAFRHKPQVPDTIYTIFLRKPFRRISIFGESMDEHRSRSWFKITVCVDSGLVWTGIAYFTPLHKGSLSISALETVEVSHGPVTGESPEKGSIGTASTTMEASYWCPELNKLPITPKISLQSSIVI